MLGLPVSDVETFAADAELSGSMKLFEAVAEDASDAVMLLCMGLWNGNFSPRLMLMMLSSGSLPLPEVQSGMLLMANAIGAVCAGVHAKTVITVVSVLGRVFALNSLSLALAVCTGVWC